MDYWDEEKTDHLEIPPEHDCPVGDDTVVEDVPRKAKDGDEGESDGDDDCRPDTNEKKEETKCLSENKEKACFSSKEADSEAPEANDQRDYDKTESTKIEL